MSDVGKLTLVRHYNQSLYEDGILQGTVNQGFCAENFCHCLGIPLEVITVDLHDMMKDDRNFVYVPEDLSELMDHVAEVARKKRRERIEYLRDELNQLETEEKEDGTRMGEDILGGVHEAGSGSG